MRTMHITIPALQKRPKVLPMSLSPGTTVARWPDCARPRSNCCVHAWSSMASASESSAMGGPDEQNATKDVQRMGTRLPPPNGPVAPNRARRAPSARCLCLKHHDRLQQQCTTAAGVDGMTGVDAMTAHHRFSGPLTHVDTREQQTFPDHLNTAARYAGRRPELVDASPRTLLIFVSERTNKRHHLTHSVR